MLECVAELRGLARHIAKGNWLGKLEIAAWGSCWISFVGKHNLFLFSSVYYRVSYILRFIFKILHLIVKIPTRIRLNRIRSHLLLNLIMIRQHFEVFKCLLYFLETFVSFILDIFRKIHLQIACIIIWQHIFLLTECELGYLRNKVWQALEFHVTRWYKAL